MITFNIVMILLIVVSIGGIYWLKHSKQFKKHDKS
jgi:hypothetical protein